MTYLSVKNFWNYQNADVWKKCKGHPPWFKHWVHRDRELDALPPVTRLLFYELLGSATRNSNVLQADLNWIYAETRVSLEDIAEALPQLIKGGWLSETATPRRSRAPSRKNREEDRDIQEEDVDKEKILRGRANGKPDKSAMFVLRTMVQNGALLDEDQLAGEARDRHLTDLQHRELLTALRARRSA